MSVTRTWAKKRVDISGEATRDGLVNVKDWTILDNGLDYTAQY